MNPTLEFFAQGLTHFREIGAIFPCSSLVSRAMAAGLDGQGSGTIVEFGAGTGAVTRKILKKMNGHHKLLAFETNPRFCDILREIDDYRLEVVNASAEFLPDYLHGQSPYIVSVLPLGIFDRQRVRNLLKTAREKLTKRGIFTQLQYIPPRNYSLISSVFKETKIKFAPWNIPPSIIYTCRKG